jgi:hypothetical protein
MYVDTPIHGSSPRSAAAFGVTAKSNRVPLGDCIAKPDDQWIATKPRRGASEMSFDLDLDFDTDIDFDKDFDLDGDIEFNTDIQGNVVNANQQFQAQGDDTLVEVDQSAFVIQDQVSSFSQSFTVATDEF